MYSIYIYNSEREWVNNARCAYVYCILFHENHLRIGIDNASWLTLGLY